MILQCTWGCIFAALPHNAVLQAEQPEVECICNTNAAQGPAHVLTGHETGHVCWHAHAGMTEYTELTHIVKVSDATAQKQLLLHTQQRVLTMSLFDVAISCRESAGSLQPAVAVST